MTSIIGTVLPIFALILLGNIVGRLPFFPAGGVRGLIFYVWYIAMPIAIFIATAANPLPSVQDIPLLAAYFIPLSLTFLMAITIGKIAFNQTATERGLYGYSVCFGNIIYMGMPMITAVYGAEGIRLIILLISVHELILISITMLTINAESGSIITAFRRALLHTLKMPLIIAIILGLISAYLQLSLPDTLLSIFTPIGLTAAPVGLFAVGAALVGIKAAGDRKQAVTATALKLFILPALVFTSCHIAGLSEVQTSILTIIAALPTGLNAFNFATTQGTGERRAATTILYSTVISVVTISLLLLN